MTQSPARPRVAILMDENTSTGATRYEASKNHFRAVRDAGGLPFGVTYLPEIVDTVVNDFDALITIGGRFAYPDDWYIGALASKAPVSERFEVEKAMVSGMLDRDKPILGVCAGMQMLACLQGCRMTPDLRETYPDTGPHDVEDLLHPVRLVPGTVLARIIGQSEMQVNTRHQEAIAKLAGGVVVSARAPDGIIEAVELDTARFAIGLQWHPEAFVQQDHPGNRIYAGLINAC